MIEKKDWPSFIEFWQEYRDGLWLPWVLKHFKPAEARTLKIVPKQSLTVME
jgi:hypothetical protein